MLGAASEKAFPAHKPSGPLRYRLHAVKHLVERSIMVASGRCRALACIFDGTGIISVQRVVQCSSIEEKCGMQKAVEKCSGILGASVGDGGLPFSAENRHFSRAGVDHERIAIDISDNRRSQIAARFLEESNVTDFKTHHVVALKEIDEGIGIVLRLGLGR
jgi:hypothetical protein